MAEFWTSYIWPLLVIVAQSVLLLVLLLVVTAYVLLADRKIWAAVQIRRGPNVVGPWGLLQSFADLIKFVLKEPIIPAGANKGVFLLAPLVTAVLALSAWAVIPVAEEWVIADINVGVLYIFAISSLGVYGIIMAGWASNSKYPFLAALRSAAQMVSYEVSIGFVIITVLLCVGSLNLTGDRRRAGRQIRHVQLVLAAAVADVRGVLRFGAGGDQPAAVRSGGGGIRAGRRLHAVEYSARPRSCCSCSASTSPSPPCAPWRPSCSWAAGCRRSRSRRSPGCRAWSGSCSRRCFMFFMFAMVKAIVPRYRYDQLMRLGWKVFLPLSLAMVVIVAGVLQFGGLAPK